MSDMRDLLEKMNWIFAGHKVGQKDGDQVRGTEKAKKKKRKTPYQEHPFKGRLVGSGGAAEEMEETVEQIAEQLRKELAEYGSLQGSGISSQSDVTQARNAQRQAYAQQKAEKDSIDSQEDSVEAQIKGINQQELGVSKGAVPLPNPQDPNSIAQFAAAMADKKAQRASLEAQKKGLIAQLASLNPFGE